MENTEYMIQALEKLNETMNKINDNLESIKFVLGGLELRTPFNILDSLVGINHNLEILTHPIRNQEKETSGYIRKRGFYPVKQIRH